MNVNYTTVASTTDKVKVIKTAVKSVLNSIHLAFISSFHRLNACGVQVMVCSLVDKIVQILLLMNGRHT